MGKRILRLEQTLKLWEDICFLTKKHLEVLAMINKTEVAYNILNGAIGHSSEFIQHVIQNGTNGYFDYKRFTDSVENQGNLIMKSWVVPYNIFSWNHNSRRVFHMTSDLQTLLSATSLDGICWDDIKWPFRSLALTLEEPITDNNGNEFDCILVSDIASIIKKWKDYEIYDFLLMSKKLDERKNLDRDTLQKRVTPRKWNKDKMERKLMHMGNDYVDHFFVTVKGEFGTHHDFISKPISISLIEAKKEAGLACDNEDDTTDYYDRCSVYDKAKHLVVSTCLYLATLPPKQFPEDWQSAENQREQEPIGEFSPAAVTTARGVFTLACESKLSQESQETIAEIRQSRISREKCPHWRRGHWRKVWGGKNNPDAPKIWILPCLVNKNRLPPNSLPPASKTILE